MKGIDLASYAFVIFNLIVEGSEAFDAISCLQAYTFIGVGALDIDIIPNIEF